MRLPLCPAFVTLLRFLPALRSHRRQRLNEAVGQKFGVLDRQLDGKVGDRQGQQALLLALSCLPPLVYSVHFHTARC